MGSVIPLLLVVVVFVLLIIVPYRRQAQRQRDVRSMQATLQPGTEVMTTSGLYGTVVSIGDGIAELEIAPGMVIRVARAAIGEIAKPNAPALEGEYAESTEDEYEDDDTAAEYDEEEADGEYEDDEEYEDEDEYEDEEADGEETEDAASSDTDTDGADEGPQDGTAPRKDGGSS